MTVDCGFKQQRFPMSAKPVLVVPTSILLVLCQRELCIRRDFVGKTRFYLASPLEIINNSSPPAYITLSIHESDILCYIGKCVIQCDTEWYQSSDHDDDEVSGCGTIIQVTSQSFSEYSSESWLYSDTICFIGDNQVYGFLVVRK